MRRVEATITMAVLALCVVLGWHPATVHAAKPRVTLTAPAKARAGSQITLSGRVHGVSKGGGKLGVRVEARVGTKARTAGSVTLKRAGKYTVRWRMPTGASVKVRATVRRAGRVLARSPWRIVKPEFLRTDVPAPTPPPVFKPPVLYLPTPSQTAISDGGPVRVTLGGVAVDAPAGAIRPGETLTIAPILGASNISGAPSVSGPFVLTSSQGQPDAPVTLKFAFGAAPNAGRGGPVLMHGNGRVTTWLPEPTEIDWATNTATAVVESFSPFDWATYWGGVMTGDRTDLPDDCVSSSTWDDWIQNVNLPNTRDQPLPLCLAEGTNSEQAVVHIVNNRGYAQVITVSGATFDREKPGWAGTLEAQLADGFAHHAPVGPQRVLIAPGSSVRLTFPKPPDQPAARTVTLRADNRELTFAGAVAWTILDSVANEIDVVSLPRAAVNCLSAATYTTDSGIATAAAHMRSCGDLAEGFDKEKFKVWKRLAKGLAVDSTFYKLIDSRADSVFPSEMSFVIRGTGTIDPAIKTLPDDMGTVSAGSTKSVTLTGTGGVAPYTFSLSAPNGPQPRWVKLRDGVLTVSPPPTAELGEYRINVWARDSTGRASPSARDTVKLVVERPDPSTVIKATQISVGGHHNCALNEDRRVACWGSNQSGQIGDGTQGPFSPVALEPHWVKNLTDAVHVSAGLNESCAVRAGGAVVCWGYESVSQRHSPTPRAIDGISDAVKVSVGYHHACAIRATGGVKCWGYDNAYGTLGDGNARSSVTPVDVYGLSDAISLSAASHSTCALRAARRVVCWGAQVGPMQPNGYRSNEHTPYEMPGTEDAVAADHACVVRSAGTVWCGNTEEYGVTNATSITIGNSHRCSVTADRRVLCWGNNDQGELGLGFIDDPTRWREASPVLGISDAVQVDAGGYGHTYFKKSHTCALRATGTVLCWGDNSYGQLGDGSWDGSAYPVEIGTAT